MMLPVLVSLLNCVVINPIPNPVPMLVMKFGTVEINPGNVVEPNVVSPEFVTATIASEIIGAAANCVNNPGTPDRFNPWPSSNPTTAVLVESVVVIQLFTVGFRCWTQNKRKPRLPLCE